MDKETLLKELEIFKVEFIKKITALDNNDNIDEKIYDGLVPYDIYKLHQKCITGKGVKIGVIDIDFNNCNGKVNVKSVVDENLNPVSNTGYGHGNLICEKIVGEDIGYAPESEVYYYNYYSIKEHSTNEYIKLFNSLIQGLEYLINLNVDIISMSVGVSISCTNEETLSYIKKFYETIKKAYDKNIILVAAAGNDGDNEIQTRDITVNLPARFSEVISVGAYNEEGNRTKYSSTGKVDIMAQAEGLYHYNQDGTLEKYYGGGTSSACPVAASIIALLKQQDNKLNQTDILNIFKEYAKDVEIEGFDNKTGYGNIVPIEVPSDFKYSELSQDKKSTESVFDDINNRINTIKTGSIYTIDSPLNVLKKKLNVEELHNKGIKGRGIKIAIIGLGCEKLEDFNIKGYYNMTSEGKEWEQAFKEHQAGNVLTSIISSKTLGIAPEADIYVLRTYKTNGWHSATDENKAINWCINNKIDVVFASQYIHVNKLKKLADMGTIVVCNSEDNTNISDTNTEYAGMASENFNTISVSWITQDNKFSTEKGNSCYLSDNIDCTAYGVGFDFMGNNGLNYFTGNNFTASKYRNLFASYQVIGIAALLKQQDPEMDVFKFKEYLKNNCKSISGLSKNKVGNGLIQAKLL